MHITVDVKHCECVHTLMQCMQMYLLGGLGSALLAVRSCRATEHISMTNAAKDPPRRPPYLSEPQTCPIETLQNRG